MKQVFKFYFIYPQTEQSTMYIPQSGEMVDSFIFIKNKTDRMNIKKHFAILTFY